MQTSKDIQDCIELFLSRGVEFLLVGGYAVAAHGAPRFTEDIDFFVRTTKDNAEKVVQALREFGYPPSEIRPEDFLSPQQVVQLGRPPYRIDILTSIDGVTWDEAWESRTEVPIGTLRCWGIGFDRLVQNKRASGRPQDLADVARLEEVRKKRP
jgi:hypothetical protein